LENKLNANKKQRYILGDTVVLKVDKFQYFDVVITEDGKIDDDFKTLVFIKSKAF
jgi:hypothetical protein